MPTTRRSGTLKGLIGTLSAVVSVRTLSRATEFLYAALYAMFPVIGLVIVVSALVSGFWLLVLVGVFFVGFGLLLPRFVPILRTASVLSLDDGTQLLVWRATMGHGSVALRDVTAVVRSARPAVWEIESATEEAIPFWLNKRNQEVQDFFARIARTHPQIETSELYAKSFLWWRCLSSP